MVLHSKKAMSPLIATVLLIAFAVALGTMIMNWGSGAESAVASPSQSGGQCQAIVSLAFQGPACYQDNKVKFTVRNIGIDRVDGIRLQIESADGNYQFDVKGSAMIAGETITKEVPMLKSEGTMQLYFVPLVSQKGQIVECYIGQLEQKGLPNC